MKKFEMVFIFSKFRLHLFYERSSYDVLNCECLAEHLNRHHKFCPPEYKYVWPASANSLTTPAALLKNENTYIMTFTCNWLSLFTYSRNFK